MPRLSPIRLRHRLPEGNPAIFHGMMSVYFEVAVAFQDEIHDRVFGEQGQHVIKERNPGLDGRLAGPVNFQFQRRDPRFFGRAVDLPLPNTHPPLLMALPKKNNVQSESELSAGNFLPEA